MGSVKDLARLSLKDPEYVAVHEHSKTSTPQGLTQNYVVCDLPQKLNFLYSFIRNHLKSKILVFASSCKQVKFIFESFKWLRPGIPLMALYGKQKQLKRMAIFDDFCKKTEAVLFATDIAARGLDIPAVHWVVQLDCPEDANTYIHRAGRTARYQKDGQALLILLPSEETEMVKALEEKKIPISKIRVNPKKLTSIQGKLAAFCARDQEMKYCAQKCVVTYARSIFLQSNKKIFDVTKLPLDEYAQSLGLPNPPRIRFLKKAGKKIKKASERYPEDSDDSSKEETGNKSRPDSIDLGITFEDESVAAKHDDLLILKKRNIHLEDLGLQPPEKEEIFDDKAKTKRPKTRIALAKKQLNKGVKLNTKVVFNDEGEPLTTVGPPLDFTGEHKVSNEALEPVPLAEMSKRPVGGISVEESRDLMEEADLVDRKVERERIRNKHKEQKLKIKKRQREEQSLTEGDEDDEETHDSDEEEESGSSNKKKRLLVEENNTSEMPSLQRKGTLAEDEELALQLLSGF